MMKVAHRFGLRQESMRPFQEGAHGELTWIRQAGAREREFHDVAQYNR